MTREEILSIEEYCAEHKVSHRKRLEELDIPFWHFYKAKKKYREDDEQEGQSGQFIQLSIGRYVPQTIPPTRTSGRSGKPLKSVEEEKDSYLTIELQNRTGTTIRIQGVITPAHLRELIAAGNDIHNQVCHGKRIRQAYEDAFILSLKKYFIR